MTKAWRINNWTAAAAVVHEQDYQVAAESAAARLLCSCTYWWLIHSHSMCLAISWMLDDRHDRNAYTQDRCMCKPAMDAAAHCLVSPLSIHVLAALMQQKALHNHECDMGTKQHLLDFLLSICIHLQLAQSHLISPLLQVLPDVVQACILVLQQGSHVQPLQLLP